MTLEHTEHRPSAALALGANGWRGHFDDFAAAVLLRTRSGSETVARRRLLLRGTSGSGAERCAVPIGAPSAVIPLRGPFRDFGRFRIGRA